MSGTRMGRLVRGTIAAGAVLVGSVAFFGCSKVETAKIEGGVVTIPVAKVTEQAKFYKYVDNGKEISYFVAKAPDGSYKAAFNACDSCFREKKGYEQQGSVMNCINCNQKFAIDRLGPNATGGCNPGYLPIEVKGDAITIPESTLKGGAKYF
ncbi:protein of unknown function DUF2318 [Citrifermentans bemidjiense Bem]|uniref:Membrane iron-sulfur containing protein FtrD-like domain-containing protein n=1 Tax=Citrifermentans bemidjiense (strain ATCC BAA-1014 / DSM 16622 / JCM 12645 / Bem) TaxID=404380 RepID=B5EIQ4_CITBB|nr:DUF2318 domain-containing protein [Citrifermentans bemidjiense]ACH38419.1 protein of unknown function DUF2318 [Citrifermentans bemidjiense Bem]